MDPKKRIERLMRDKVDVCEKTGCWLWRGTIANGRYGIMNERGKTTMAHRFFYEHHRGPIPPDLEVDHLCRVRHCVNPEHMELVTRRENIARGNCSWAIIERTGACQRGHPWPENMYVNPNSGVRECRACIVASNARWRERNPEHARELSRLRQQRYRARLKVAAGK